MTIASVRARASRSLLSAWTSRHDGPAWAPWLWTAALDTVVALVLTLALPREGGGLLKYFVISQAIGLTIHALFFSAGHLLRLDAFELPPPLRAIYFVSVVLAGSWLGYAAAMWVLLGDWDELLRHMTGAARYLLVIPAAWAVLTIALFAALDRLRARQLELERAHVERARAEREAIAARLQLLNAQIEPHFLYNTLATLGALIPPAEGGSGAGMAARLLDALVRYLRASSRNMARPLVPLRDELESVRGYLDVMDLRMGGRLTVRYEVPDEAADLMLPPAALQGLVENAIKHGLEPSLRGGTILVSARQGPAGWELRVEDTGVGLADRAVMGASTEPLQARAARGAGDASTGTGLANLAERLRLALGSQATLGLEARAGGGAIATIRLPGVQPDARSDARSDVRSDVESVMPAGMQPGAQS